MKPFSALLLTIALASTFFSGINIGTDSIAKQTLEKQLSQVLVDVEVHLGWGSPVPPPDDIARMMNEINSSNIEGLTHIEVTSCFFANVQLPRTNETRGVCVAGILDNSIVYNGLALVNGSSALRANEAYLWTGSKRAENLTLGDELRFERFSLTIVGLVDLDERALEIAKGSLESKRLNLLIVNWNKTLAKVPEVMGFETRILILLDRNLFINLLDIDGSVWKAREVTDQIRGVIAPNEPQGHGVENHLDRFLTEYRQSSQFMRIGFVLTSLPVFFVAYYIGSSVSEVSYNLRRREIGLLLTKGFSRRRILRMLLAQALLVGLVATVIGIGLSFILIPIVIGSGGLSGVPLTMGVDTVALVLFFTVGLSLLAVLRPARKASKLEVAEALQEYRFEEEAKPTRSRWSWIALMLGSYKIIMWITGINLLPFTWAINQQITNMLLLVALSLWIYFDMMVLNYVAPILFLWGVTKVFVQGSQRFQDSVSRLVTLAGTLGLLSAKNVRRNPARTAAISLLIALVIGFSFQIIGSYASEQDYVLRQVRFDIGSDVSVELTSMRNLQSTIDKIRSIPGVSSVTVEYVLSGELQQLERGILHLKAVNPEQWLDVAYYDPLSFAGKDVALAFEEMKSDNHTIILEHKLANTLGLNVGDEVAASIGGRVCNLRIVGLFGPKPPPFRDMSYEWSYYWSYIHEDLLLSIIEEPYWGGRILVKAAAGADDMSIAEEIRGLQLDDVSSVSSVTEGLDQWSESSTDLTGARMFLFGATVSTEIHRLGLVFAFLATSVGTALVTLASLSERAKEVSVMSVRGMSFAQIARVLLVENLAVVGFAIMLGAVVGVVVLNGNLSALNSIPMSRPTQETWVSYSPIVHRIVFPSDSMLALVGCCGLVLASTVLPIIVMARRYISEAERIVKEA